MFLGSPPSAIDVFHHVTKHTKTTKSNNNKRCIYSCCYTRVWRSFTPGTADMSNEFSNSQFLHIIIVLLYITIDIYILEGKK